MNMRTFFITFTFLIISNCGFTQNLIETESPFSAEVTLNMLVENIKNRGLNIFTEIDHSQAAEHANMELSPIYVLVFGNPKVGTKLMQADPRVGIELPLKFLIYENQGITRIAYANPENYSETYNLKDQVDILENMSNVMNTIVQEVVKQ